MAFLEGKMDVRDVVVERKDCAAVAKMKVKVRDELEVWPVVTGVESESRNQDEHGDGPSKQIDDINVDEMDHVSDEMEVDEDQTESVARAGGHDAYRNTAHNNVPYLHTRSTHDIRTNDLPTSLHITPFLPFDPLTTVLFCDEDTQMCPELVTTLSTIFALYNNIGIAMLRQLTTKYGPEPVFRAGIRELLQSRVEEIVKTPLDTGLGLTTEVRNVLKGVFEGYQGYLGMIGGSGNGGEARTIKRGELNAAEIRLLAQVTGTGRETIEMFWDDMNVRRRAWGGLCTVVARREIERMRAEKEMRRTREDAMRQSDRLV